VGLGRRASGGGKVDHDGKDLEEVVAEYQVEMVSMKQKILELQRRLRIASKAGDEVRERVRK